MNVFAGIVAVILIVCALSLIVGGTIWCLSHIVASVRKRR